ncbi:hypothetical protein BDK51DRAFT_43519 [Blyttiomyces helicus]|uniref:UBX domain-containing protein n=1 Tax=Blyttiomyces helicus TaxID=388810 RepID=A0A4P9WQH9_9FUNG|nr:hypothetical protein BDK51DRAFT_43519 [Blyttiomyces helicus]|eukprot:RKO94645.1 hypothetical protein BDK51DRAFT_43519 [Blyttiomyces helicus]
MPVERTTPDVPIRCSARSHGTGNARQSDNLIAAVGPTREWNSLVPLLIPFQTKFFKTHHPHPFPPPTQPSAVPLEHRARRRFDGPPLPLPTMTTVPLKLAPPITLVVPDDGRRFSTNSQRTTIENRESRIARVQSLRRNRTSSHIMQFYKLTVSLASGSNLEVTIDREQTIEFLAKQIEAECAFGSIKPGQDVDSGNPPMIVPIEQIYDGGGLALKFSDRVCDVLEFNDTVFAISSGEGAL